MRAVREENVSERFSAYLVRKRLCLPPLRLDIQRGKPNKAKENMLCSVPVLGATPSVPQTARSLRQFLLTTGPPQSQSLRPPLQGQFVHDCCPFPSALPAATYMILLDRLETLVCLRIHAAGRRFCLITTVRIPMPIPIPHHSQRSRLGWSCYRIPVNYLTAPCWRPLKLRQAVRI